MEARWWVHMYLWMREQVVMRTPGLSSRARFISAYRSVETPSKAP